MHARNSKRAMAETLDPAVSGTSNLASVARYRPYPDYRDSRVEWIGSIPSHWTIKATRREFEIRLGKMLQPTASSPQDSPTPYFKAQHVQWESVRTTDLPTMYADSIDHAHYGVNHGDLLVCEGGEVGRAGIVCRPPNGSIIQNALHRVRSVGTSDICFLMYLLKHAASQDWIKIHCDRATIAHFTSEKLGGLMIPWAPLSEQHAIVVFLDRETKKIDALIAKKERLIELLEEKSSALITRTVTKGLNPTVPLKDSEIEWLAWIPAHWDVKRINQTSEILRGKFTHRPRNDPSLYGGDWPFIQTGDVAHARKGIKGYRQTLNERGLAVSKMFPEGTLVMTIAANIGDVAVLDFAACFPDSIVGFVPRHGIERDYLFFVFSAIKPELLRDAPVNTQGNLNIERLSSSSPIPIPPRTEQYTVARYLDRETTKIDDLVANVRQAIDCLRELRAALVSAAVTGKIDVRDKAA